MQERKKERKSMNKIEKEWERKKKRKTERKRKIETVRKDEMEKERERERKRERKRGRERERKEGRSKEWWERDKSTFQPVSQCWIIVKRLNQDGRWREDGNVRKKKKITNTKIYKEIEYQMLAEKEIVLEQ